jgi:hypothetical protein
MCNRDWEALVILARLANAVRNSLGQAVTEEALRCGRAETHASAAQT